MMQTLQRLQTRLLLGAQADVIDHFLECEHNLSAEKVENWKQLLTTLREVNVCFHDMDEELTRMTNELGDHRQRVLDDAGRIGQLQQRVVQLEYENDNLKKGLAKAIALIDENQPNQTQLWRN